MAKVLREIIRINEDLCDGCGECITSCAEGALEIIDGKAKLKGEILCDGAGACLGSCPTGALTIEKRESEDYSEEAVHANLRSAASAARQPVSPIPFPMHAVHGGGCPGSAMRQFGPPSVATAVAATTTVSLSGNLTPRQTQLRQWPVQLMLVSPQAPYFKNADLLIAADCVPFAFADFHERFLKEKALVVGCPKLDDLPHYFDKLTAIIQANNLKSIEVLKMEVPCCNGIAQAAIEARKRAGVDVPVTVTTVGVQGDILERFEA
jgi:ferredoxin